MEKNEFITTSDGMIGFRKSEYRLHTCGNLLSYEIVLWTDSYPTGRIVKFSSKETRDTAAKEIVQQLTPSLK